MTIISVAFFVIGLTVGWRLLDSGRAQAGASPSTPSTAPVQGPPQAAVDTRN